VIYDLDYPFFVVSSVCTLHMLIFRSRLQQVKLRDITDNSTRDPSRDPGVAYYVIILTVS
jgi:hypothetical protein